MEVKKWRESQPHHGALLTLGEKRAKRRQLGVAWKNMSMPRCREALRLLPQRGGDQHVAEELVVETVKLVNTRSVPVTMLLAENCELCES